VLQRSKTPLPPSRSIRENPCSSVAKRKTPLIRGPKPPVAPLAPNGGEGPGVRGQNHPHTNPKQPPRSSFAASREPNPLRRNPSRPDLGLESPSYENHKTTIPTFRGFRGFRVFRGSNTTPRVPSVKIRCSSVAKKTPLIRGPKPPVAPLAPNGGEGPGVRGQHHPHTTPPTTTPQLLRGFA